MTFASFAYFSANEAQPILRPFASFALFDVQALARFAVDGVVVLGGVQQLGLDPGPDDLAALTFGLGWAMPGDDRPRRALFRRTGVRITLTIRQAGADRLALSDVAKIVGVSDDRDKVQRCEAEAKAAFGERATATRSQPYYLDVTNKDANKGAVVAYLSDRPPSSTRASAIGSTFVSRTAAI